VLPREAEFFPPWSKDVNRFGAATLDVVQSRTHSEGKTMKHIISGLIAAVFAAFTFTSAAQTPAPSGGSSADTPKTEKSAKKTKKAKKPKKSTKAADAPASEKK
jgi:hypothetical protein